MLDKAWLLQFFLLFCNSIPMLEMIIEANLLRDMEKALCHLRTPSPPVSLPVKWGLILGLKATCTY
jgi:hypothetical protein